MRKILCAFIVRHSNIGYAQGMHTNVLYLLIRCAGDEEAAFWAFCALVEDARARDFYAKPPAAMNGFLIDSQVLVKLTRIALPKVGGDRRPDLLARSIDAGALVRMGWSGVRSQRFASNRAIALILVQAPEYFSEIVVPMLAPKLLIPALVDEVNLSRTATPSDLSRTATPSDLSPA